MNGQTLKKARLAKGMSAEMLHKATGIHRVTIYRIENGQTKHPRYITVKTLADALGIKQ